MTGDSVHVLIVATNASSRFGLTVGGRFSIDLATEFARRPHVGSSWAIALVHSPRRTIDLSHARPPICVALLFAAALLAGCQSGAERDVVQREMRQQEDQIYALEDYLAEYQQLLCDTRAENSRLKRQLVQRQFRVEGANDSRDADDMLPSPPASPPTAPDHESLPEAIPEVAPPSVPSLDYEAPEVPPLGETSDNEPELLDEPARAILPVAAELPVDEVGEVVVENELIPNEVASAIVLRGEVQLDDAQSGPRVLLEVEPVTSDGRPTKFDGRLSILVLDPAARKKEQQLSRWDFTQDDLQSMVKDDTRGTTFEFPLQLPPESPAKRPLELWVRLIAEDGAKLLGRTAIDLGRASRFASAEVEAQPVAEYEIQTASAEVPVSPRRPKSRFKSNGPVHQSGWQTARPGEVTPTQSAGLKSATDWKLATRPIPVAESAPLVESTPVRREGPVSAGRERYDVAAAPDWSPERPADGEAVSPPEPAWSPTR